MCILQIFLPVCGLYSNSLAIVFVEQKFSILMKLINYFHHVFGIVSISFQYKIKGIASNISPLTIFVNFWYVHFVRLKKFLYS